ncbi:hypothetical protein Cni_G07002 [Canna indica]|uniref:Uncharacterized protein n=1 Tax=Canna indica TaxID=4628 RepID=A0AAQ3JY67_9LILI|nr:hypothetical protein Cni_G07002 [Canna indica]
MQILSSTASPRPKVKSSETMEGEADSSGGQSEDAFKPIINIKIPEQPVVQQDFVDMFMKSMQQFTESLAKLKLPMDIDNNSTTAANGNSETTSTTTENGSSGSEKTLPTRKGNGSRVFYGSRRIILLNYTLQFNRLIDAVTGLPCTSCLWSNCWFHNLTLQGYAENPIMLDAPVYGGVPAAEAGTVTPMVLKCTSDQFIKHS